MVVDKKISIKEALAKEDTMSNWFEERERKDTFKGMKKFTCKYKRKKSITKKNKKEK
jgi:hypothetical protein